MDNTITKRCPSCRNLKELSEYHLNKKSKSKFKIQPYCKECTVVKQREWIANNPELYKKQKLRQRLRRFNLSVEKFEELLDKQNHKCAICQIEVDSIFVSRLSVDHNHKCCPGKTSCGRCVRGLLCSNCNSGLGHFKDNIELLRSAVRYLTDEVT